MHPDGYVELRDRAKDIIISGGENVSTIEVEQVLLRHPAVLEAAVIAMPSEKWGEGPIAFVTLRDGGEADRAGADRLRPGALAGFKAPEAVRFGALPKTSTGKVQKYELRERARAGATEGSDPSVAPGGRTATTASASGSPGTSRPDRPST